MNYIYDVLVNFNEKLYDFYEWNINDEIIHVRKIPLFKISSQSLLEIRNNQVKINNELLNKIKDKTEIFTSKELKRIEFACLLSDGAEVLAITFNNDGISISKSKLLIDEDCEVVEVCERVSEINFDYKTIKIDSVDNFKTRKEMEIDYYIKQEIKLFDRDDNIDKLKYLYYECFDDKEDNKEKIISRINIELERNWHRIALKLYNFFKLTSINK